MNTSLKIGFTLLAISILGSSVSSYYTFFHPKEAKPCQCDCQLKGTPAIYIIDTADGVNRAPLNRII